MTSVAIAYSANDLQFISGGLFILGLGTQVKAHIERRFSMTWSKPAARMREYMQAVRAIWDCWESGTPLQFNGEFYQHTRMVPTFSPGANLHGTPHIYLAGVGPLMTEVAAEVGESYFVHPFHTQKSFAELSKPALARGLEKSARSREAFTVSAQLLVATGKDEESLQKALSLARSQIAFYASTPAYAPVLGGTLLARFATAFTGHVPEGNLAGDGEAH